MQLLLFALNLNNVFSKTTIGRNTLSQIAFRPTSQLCPLSQTEYLLATADNRLNVLTR